MKFSKSILRIRFSPCHSPGSSGWRQQDASQDLPGQGGCRRGPREWTRRGECRGREGSQPCTAAPGSASAPTAAPQPGGFCRGRRRERPPLGTPEHRTGTGPGAAAIPAGSGSEAAPRPSGSERRPCRRSEIHQNKILKYLHLPIFFRKRQVRSAGWEPPRPPNGCRRNRELPAAASAIFVLFPLAPPLPAGRAWLLPTGTGSGLLGRELAKQIYCNTIICHVCSKVISRCRRYFKTAFGKVCS